MSEEVHQLKFTTNYADIKKADFEYKRLLEREKQITREKDVLGKIEVEAAKTKNKQILIEEQIAKAKRLQLVRDEAAEKRRLLAQERTQSSRLTGQSTVLGSLGAVDQQLKYYTGLRNAANVNSAEFSKYSTKVRELGDEKRRLIGTTNSLTSSLTNTAAGYIGVGLAISKTLQFTKQSIQAFAEDELAVKKLQLGLQRLGQEDYFGRLIQQQTLLQATTFFTDSQIANAQAMLTSFKLSGAEIELLTPRLLDMATQLEQTGQGTADLQQLAIQLGKATGGELVGGLKRYGVIMTKTQEEQLKLAHGMERTQLVAKILDENFSGLATNMQNTTAFSINYMTKALDELKEGFGQGLVSNIENSSKSADQLAADLQTVKEVGNTLAQVMSGRWILDFQKWQDSVRNDIGNILSDWLGMRDEMETPINAAIRIQVITPDQEINTKEPGAEGGTKIKPGTKRSGTKKTPKDAIAELIKKINDEIELQRLQGKLTAEYLITQKAILTAVDQENLKLEQKIALLQAIETLQGRISARLLAGLGLGDPLSLNFPLSGTSETLNFRRNIRVPIGGTGDPRADMTGDETRAFIEEQERLEREKLGHVQGAWSASQSMLENFGLMKGDTAQIVAMINSIIGGISSGFNLIGSIVGIVGGFLAGGPVGSVVGGIGGGGGFLSPGRSIPERMGNGRGMGTTVIIKNPVTFRKAFEVETRLDTVRGDIDL